MPPVGYTFEVTPDKDKPKEPPKPDDPPDGRGERPTDPNELAAWILEQTTGQDRPPNGGHVD